MSRSSVKIGRKEIKLRPIASADPNQEINKSAEQHQKLIEQINQAEQQLKQLEHEMDIKINQVEQELSEKRNAWEVEKKALIETTKTEAEEAGYEKGKAEGLEAVQKKIALADQIIDQAKDERLKIIGQSESVILELATKIAAKIVTYEIEENDAFLSIVSHAIEEIDQKGHVQIYTSVEDYAFIQDQREQLLTLIVPDVVLSIHPSCTLTTGDCMIKTPHGKLDASIDQQLTKVKKRLIEVMEEMRREHQ